ncbi:MAG: response regulator [Lachnospiraceae bacterium]|nr:response regulator [Lachnospiraceae bacterium]
MYYNISFDIAAILLLVVLAVGMRTVLYTDTPGHKLMRSYVHAVIVVAVTDIVTAYTICYGYLIPDFLNLILNTIYQYSSIVCVAVAMKTILNYYPSATKRSVTINRVLLCLLAAFVTANLFTGWMFRFENGKYIHGSIYYIAYLLSLAIVFHMLYVVLVNRADRPGVISRIILLFLFLPTVFTVIQMIFGNVLLIAFGEAFSALIMLFALETPDYRKLMKTMNELEIAREEANIANRTKSDFLASMSHEIRTPINGILGMNTMILRDSNDPQIVEYAENIKIAGNGLLSIINDILDLSKIESGGMEINPANYDLFSIMNTCYQMNRMRASENGLTLTFSNDPDMPAGYYGDEVRIRQIINNIVSNGIKYTKEGSVTVRTNFIEDEAGADTGTLMILVEDTGIGIKEEDIGNLFKSFTRLEESRNRHIEGTGLGLHITKQLVDMMNGTIEVKSEYGKGSVFTVRIPQRVTDRKRMGDFAERLKDHVNISSSETGRFKAPGRRILIVDDVKMNVLVLKGLLRGTEITIDSALSGAEAIKKTEENKYDIIFMDHLMPEMDGIEAFHKIRDDANGINRDTPVVVLTANALVGMRDTYMNEGFREYISKPVEQEELLKVAEELLGENGQRTERE